MSDSDSDSSRPSGPPPVPPGSTQPANPPPSPSGYPGPPVQQQVYVNQAPRTNGLAVAAFVLGLLWICYIGSVLGVIFGHVALYQIKQSNDTQGGKGLAIAGLVLGYLGLSVFIFFFIAGVASIPFSA